MFGSRFPGFERRGSPFERHPRMFKKGDMKYVILELVKEKPSHGYELTQALEDRFHGTYSPSPGSIYPILQLLEDMGYVSSNTNEERRSIRLLMLERSFWKIRERSWKRLEGVYMGCGIRKTKNSCTTGEVPATIYVK